MLIISVTGFKKVKTGYQLILDLIQESRNINRENFAFY
jgi:hypothetical protein